MKLKNAYIFLLILFVTSIASAQWVKEKGKGYYKVSAWYLEADEHYTSTGAKDPNATRGQFNVNFYGEYGLSNKLTTTLYLPFFARTYQNEQVSGTTGNILAEGEALNSIGDIDVGITYGIVQKGNLALSASLIFGIPSGNNSGGSDGSFQTSDGEFNQYIKSAIGIPFHIGDSNAYASAHVGFNNRTKGFSDELRTGLELGVNTLSDKLWLIGKLNVIQSLNNGSLTAQNAQGSIFANNIEFTCLGIEANYYFTKKLGVSINYTSALGGRIIYAAPSYSAGLFLDIK
ncbi:hypothetical protein MHTCC0001_18040 [Flavobacteriaceae bacterium MHTCC 0001]